MENARHTPGPWHRNIKPGRKYSVIFAGRNTHVMTACVAGLADDEIEANIDLVTAAPDMLDALERAEFILSSPTLSHMADCVGGLTAIRAAIAKAKGGEG